MGPVVVGRQDLGVGLPLVGVVAAVVPVASRERGPQALRGGGPPTAQHPGHDAARGPFDRRPQPDFALAPPDEGPQLIQFQGFRSPALGLFRPATRQPGRGQRRFFLSAWRWSPRHAGGAHNAALGVALGEQGFDLGILRRLGHGRWHKPRLVSTRLALVLWLAALRTIAANVFAAAAGT